VTRRGGAWLAAAGSLATFAAAFYLRLDAAYGPFNLSFHPSDWPADWTVVWELWRHGQIASDIVGQGAGLGAAAAGVPWVVFGLLTRRRGTR
jgi:hypothetical protein